MATPATVSAIVDMTSFEPAPDDHPGSELTRGTLDDRGVSYEVPPELLILALAAMEAVGFYIACLYARHLVTFESGGQDDAGGEASSSRAVDIIGDIMSRLSLFGVLWATGISLIIIHRTGQCPPLTRATYMQYILDRWQSQSFKNRGAGLFTWIWAHFVSFLLYCGVVITDVVLRC